MINLGLNRKISNVLSKNLNDPESDIYKEISSIAGETTESDSIVNNPFGINIAECIEENKEPFDDCDLESIEELYLLNATSISNLPMERFTSLKKLMLPNFTNFNPEYDNYIILDNAIANLPIEIMLLKGSIRDGGMFSGYPIFNSLETLILPDCEYIGFSGIRSSEFPNLNSVILLNSTTFENRPALYEQTNCNYNIYVLDNLVSKYSYTVYPISQLPQEIREELELCQIQI